MSVVSGDRLHAVLVGVGRYSCDGPPADGLPDLPGSLHDVDDMRRYLCHELEVPADHLAVLTTSTTIARHDTDGSTLPTLPNILCAIRQLDERTRPGDQVLIYFSGHGSRVPTMLPGVKGATALDECLMPYPDEANPTGRLLHDVELGFLVDRLRAKSLRVTLVLDCCHSGGALRELADRTVKGTSWSSPAPATSPVASLDQLATAWRQRALRGGPDPFAPVLLAACLPAEMAFEADIEGRRRGVFSHWLTDTLRRRGPDISCRRLIRRVTAKVRCRFDHQTPMLLGDPDRRLFGGRLRRSIQAVDVLRVEPDGSLILATGAPHGVTPGARFDLYPAGQVEPTTVSRFGEVEIVDAGATISRARVRRLAPGRGRPRAGDRAIWTMPGALRLRRAVRCVDAHLGTGPTALDRRLRRHPASFLEPVGEIGGADFVVGVDSEGHFEIADAAGEPLPHVGPPLRADAAQSDALFNRLEHLARFRNIQELENPCLHSPVVDALDLEWLRVNAGQPLLEGPPPAEESIVERGDILCGQQGEHLGLLVHNRASEGLHIVVLDLSPGWGVEVVYPRLATSVPLEPGERYCFPLVVNVPLGAARSRDILKVVAVSRPVDFRWLELEKLGHTPLGLVDRGCDPEHALETMFRSLSRTPPMHRALEPEPMPDTEWTTAQIHLELGAADHGSCRHTMRHGCRAQDERRVQCHRLPTISRSS